MTVPRWSWGDDIATLRRTLARGGIIAVPTESSYALAVDPRDADAVKRVDTIKGRDARQPHGVVVADLEQIFALGIARSAPGLEAVARHWPAALSVVLALENPLPAAAASVGLAVRIPAHDRLRALLAALGTGLTASSANRSGEAGITDPVELDALLVGVDAWIVDGGRLPGGEPSTLVRWRREEFEILRHGRFPAAVLRGETDAARA